MEDAELIERVIACATEVHRHLGPGLLEGIYEDCLSHELALRDIAHQRQVPLPIVYKGASSKPPTGSISSSKTGWSSRSRPSTGSSWFMRPNC